MRRKNFMKSINALNEIVGLLIHYCESCFFSIKEMNFGPQQLKSSVSTCTKTKKKKKKKLKILKNKKLKNKKYLRIKYLRIKNSNKKT